MQTLILKFLLGRGIGKLQEIVSKAIRHSITGYGTVLVSQGLASQDNIATVEGAGVFLAGLALSVARTWLGEKFGKKNGGFAFIPFLLVLFTCALFAANAFAADVTINWQIQTEYEDGSPLTLQEIQRFDLGCGPTSGDRSTDVRTWIDTSTTTRTEAFAVGTHFCALRIAAMGAATGNAVITSDWSNEVTFTVAPTKPNPPTILSAATS